MPVSSNILEVSWTRWKDFSARPGATTYYTVVDSNPFEAIAIDPRFVYKSFLTDASDLSEFNDDYLSSALEVHDIDDAIALANKLEAHNNIAYDTNNNPAVVEGGTAHAVNQGGLMISGSDGVNAQLLAMDSSGRPKIVQYDTNGNLVARTENTTLPGNQGGLVVSGWDGTSSHIFKTDSSGRLRAVISDANGTSILLNAGGNLKNTIYDASGNSAVGTDGSAFPGTAGVVIVGGTDGTNTQAIATDSTGRVKVDLFDNAGNGISSTSSALDINIKSQTNAVKVSKSTADNAVNNAIFVTMSDGTAALGTTGNPIFVNNKDGSGNALTSTTGKLDVGLTGANTVKLTDSAGTNITLNTGGSLKNTIYDANGNIAVGTDGSAFPGTAGVVIVGGTDGTNTQAIATDTTGRVKVDLFDNAGNALNSTTNALNVSLRDSAGTAITLNAGGSLKETLYDASGSAITATSNALDINVKSQTNALKISKTTADNAVNNAIFVTMSDGTAALGTTGNPIFVSTASNAQSSIVNRDGTRSETAFGQIKVAQEDVLISATFADGTVPGKIQRYVEGPGTYSVVNGSLRLTAGTAIGRVRVTGEQRHYYVSGVGIHTMISIILGDTGASGCVRSWGAMDDRALNGYFFQLNGTALQIVRRSNGSDTTTAAASWNIDNTITPDTNGHIWEVLYQWLGVGRIIFRRDGQEVHTIEYQGTSSSTSTQNPHMVPFIDIQNTSTQGVSRTMDIGSIHLSYEGMGARKAVSREFSSATTAQPSTTTNGTESGVLAIQFRATRQGLSNMSIASIRRITVVTAGSNNGTTDVVIKKNASFGASTTFTPNEQPNTPTTDWASIVPTATVSGSNATGSGYGATTNLAYKITALGHIGETPASNASSTVSSGSPAKQINLSWPGVAHAAGYNIYRQLAGAGNFVYIGTTTDLSFTDNAHIASAATPPVSNTAEGDSWMAEAENLASGNPGFTSNTGRVVSLTRLNPSQVWVQEYQANKLTLLPGETLLITATPGANNLFTTAIVEWREGVPE